VFMKTKLRVDADESLLQGTLIADEEDDQQP
jgi:hypothetical protein